MLCWFLLHNNVDQLCVYICALPLQSPSYPHPHPTPLGHHRAPSWAPCAIRQSPTSYLLYTWSCIYVNPNLPVHPVCPLLPAVSARVFSTSAFLFLPFSFSQRWGWGGKYFVDRKAIMALGRGIIKSICFSRRICLPGLLLMNWTPQDLWVLPREEVPQTDRKR